MRRLVSRAYPTTSIELQEELAAEHFLKGLKNAKIAYEVLSRQPKTVATALDLVVQLQHNYQATLGRDYEYNARQRSRRVTWKEDSIEEKFCEDRYEECDNIRQVTTPVRNFDNQSLQSEIRALRNLLERTLLKESTPTTTGTKAGCFLCCDKTHFKRDCPKRSRSPSPSGRSQNSGDYGQRPIYKIGKGQGLFIPIQVEGNKVFAIIDTGADVTVLSRAFAEKVGLSSTAGRKANLQNAES